MENQLKFMHIIYNQDTESIAFIHLGKPTLKDRIKYNCEPCNRSRNNFAFKPRSIEEFLLFLENTELTPSRNYSDLSFKCFRVRPSKEIEDELPFNWLATRFSTKFFNSPDKLRIFINRCNAIKQEKLNEIKSPTNERE